ncbi:MAG: DUF4249 domain-containing protein [bacterium]|nr:MAG: DUF4249 domain-containing protein [bacterium]
MMNKKRIETNHLKRFWIFFAYIVIWISALSCYRDIIDLDLESVDPQLVIEGNITDQVGPYQIRISKTGGYNQLNNFPRISGAEVFIHDNLGNSEMLGEAETGLYLSQSLHGRIGRTYSLQVQAEGKEYRANSKMPEALTLDFLTLQNHGQEFILSCGFTDREGMVDFCRLKIYKNGELVEKYLYHGEYTDGEQIILDEFGVTFSRNDNIMVELLTITEETYEYLAMLNPDEDGGGYDSETPDFFPVSAANPKTNLSNNALGYFSAHTVRRYYKIVQ